MFYNKLVKVSISSAVIYRSSFSHVCYSKDQGWKGYVKREMKRKVWPLNRNIQRTKDMKVMSRGKGRGKCV